MSVCSFSSSAVSITVVVKSLEKELSKILFTEILKR